MRQLQADKAILEAKLKEALAVQPAALDPRELARAEEKIRGCMKENDLLKVTLAQEKAKPLPALTRRHWMKRGRPWRRPIASSRSKPRLRMPWRSKRRPSKTS